ncbi:hypothetical protein FACUT_12299 [Fusarium acutatum]|uniref:Uncharacterized protein n=1 Tax=Fusarium acutatum TaxID=78861 RepID=A0A8H4JBL9_9HYPO|nr:hypothetical protein FACUT_12299 [Fusarium acutatum]
MVLYTRASNQRRLRAGPLMSCVRGREPGVGDDAARSAAQMPDGHHVTDALVTFESASVSLAKPSPVQPINSHQRFFLVNPNIAAQLEEAPIIINCANHHQHIIAIALRTLRSIDTRNTASATRSPIFCELEFFFWLL